MVKIIFTELDSQDVVTITAKDSANALMTMIEHVCTYKYNPYVRIETNIIELMYPDETRESIEFTIEQIQE